MWAPLSPEALELIARHSPIVEVGAGDGTWARALRDVGAEVRAFDINPRGAGVERGDHLTAAQHDGALLMIWPPDGTVAQAWIDAKPWPRIILIGNLPRLRLDFSGYAGSMPIRLPSGRKGSNALCVWRRT